MARRILVVTVLVLLLAGQALAQRPGRPFMESREGRWDIALQTRYTTSQTYEGEGGSSAEFKDNLGWGFGIGYNLSEVFNLGFKVSWKRLSYDAKVIAGEGADNPGEEQTWSGQMDSSNLSLTAAWTPLKGKFSPYANGSLGWLNVDSNIVAGYQQGCYWYPYWGYVCGYYPATYGTSATPYDLGAGLRMGVSETLFFRLGYEYSWASKDGIAGQNVLRVDFGGLL